MSTIHKTDSVTDVLARRTLGGSSGAMGESFRTAFVDAKERNAAPLGTGLLGSAKTVATSSVQDEFMAYASMSVPDKIFYALLSQMGISKAEYEAMPPDDKGEIRRQLAQLMQDLNKVDQQEQLL